MENQDNMENYFYVIHTVPPEMLADVAYRRSRAPDPDQFKIKKIKCPYCKLPFKDVDVKTKVELFCYPARKRLTIRIRPEACPHCHCEVGLHYIA